MAQYTSLYPGGYPGANLYSFSAKAEAEVMADVTGGATSVRSTAAVVRSVYPRAIRAIFALLLGLLLR